jgi:hypothetical protein
MREADAVSVDAGVAGQSAWNVFTAKDARENG